MEAPVRKLALDVNALQVESSEAARPERAAGTVHAHVDTRWGETCVTQCATGPCDCWLTDPSCEIVCG